MVFNVCLEGTWLVARDKVKLTSIPVATVSCQMAKLVMLSMNFTAMTNVSYTQQRKLSIIV